MAEKFKVFVTDGVSPSGVGVLKACPQIEVIESPTLKENELTEKLRGCDALVVRSQTQVTKALLQACPTVRAVGRAGVGVDNVDVDAATEKGVVVMNTPAGNTVSTAEQAFTLLLGLARHLPQAHASMAAGLWDRKSFQGTELCGKTLGILGMGRIGGEVARRAIAFGMRVLAYDPYLSATRARSLQVELIDRIEDLLPLCDFLTLHLPMTDETRGILSEARLKLCRKGVKIVNCARGGLVAEKVLIQAMESGQVGGAALDVFEDEPLAADHPLRKQKKLILTPHLGASTAEAQESVGIEIAEAIRDYLTEGAVRNAVNVPSVDARTMAKLRPQIEFGYRLGRLLSQIAPARCDRLTITYAGKIGDEDTTPLTRSILKGFLYGAGGAEINEVNALKMAANFGLKVSETKQAESGEYSELISVRVNKNEEGSEVSGTFFGTSPRIVRINDQWMEARPEGFLLLMENKDRPGIVGWIGTLLGKHKVNIASMTLSRSAPGSKALSVINLDSAPDDNVLKEILADRDITSVKVVKI
ncbi:MAG: phosphoglycerate dehydrogenase [Verrucomicrobia bacterium]|nr:phosphoglycerate dehydrogenase [Verrucomicrobiota bacterium]